MATRSHTTKSRKAHGVRLPRAVLGDLRRCRLARLGGIMEALDYSDAHLSVQTEDIVRLAEQLEVPYLFLRIVIFADVSMADVRKLQADPVVIEALDAYYGVEE